MREDFRGFRKFVIKFAFAIFLLALFLATDSKARDYKVRKKKRGFTVDIAINRNPPILGDNDIRIKIKDRGGSMVTGAEVQVNYYMPPMPGMPPMNYTMPARLQGEEYRATMDLIMTGPWNIVIKVKESDQSWRVSFPIDVR